MALITRVVQGTKAVYYHFLAANRPSVTGVFTGRLMLSFHCVGIENLWRLQHTQLVRLRGHLSRQFSRFECRGLPKTYFFVLSVS